MSGVFSDCFHKIDTPSDVENSHAYQCYELTTPGLVLFDITTGQPLVALQVRCKDDSTKVSSDKPRQKGQTLLFPYQPLVSTANASSSSSSVSASASSSSHHFQQIVNQDNQEVDFVFTNFDVSSSVNFAMLNKKGEAIHRVNVAGPNSSLVIPSDASNDDMNFVLKTIQRQVRNAVTQEMEEKAVTVDQDEQETVAKTKKDKEGLEYTITVMPQANPDFVKQFEQTEWRAVSQVVVYRKPRVTKGAHRGRGSIQLESAGMPIYDGTPLSRGGSIDDTDNHSSSVELEEAEEEDDDAEDEEDGEEEESCIVRQQSTKHKISPVVADEKRESKRQRIGQESCKESCVSASSATIPNTTANIAKASYIARMAGDRQIKVSTVACQLEFDYETRSAPCTLGLSVFPDKQCVFNSKITKEDLVDAFKTSIQLIQDIQRQKVLVQIKKTFQSTECSVCMSANPTTVLALCGHITLCTEKACVDPIQKCPICRAFVIAKLQIA